MGPPASGKGTQGRRLGEELGVPYLSTGVLLRSAIADQSPLGVIAIPYLERGEYVPDDVMIPMILEWVSQRRKGWVLDGFPRTLPQAEELDKALEEKPIAVVLKVPDEELRRRVGLRRECPDCHRVTTFNGDSSCSECGGLLVVRADDDAQNFENRLSEFQKNVVPAINYFSQQNRIFEVDGTGSPEQVWERILSE